MEPGVVLPRDRARFGHHVARSRGRIRLGGRARRVGERTGKATCGTGSTRRLGRWQANRLRAGLSSESPPPLASPPPPPPPKGGVLIQIWQAVLEQQSPSARSPAQGDRLTAWCTANLQRSISTGRFSSCPAVGTLTVSGVLCFSSWRTTSARCDAWSSQFFGLSRLSTWDFGLMFIAFAFGTPADQRDGRSSLHWQTERADNTYIHVDTVTVDRIDTVTVDRKQIIVNY